MMPSPDWERLYSAAVLESDRSKLNSRIDAAVAAIDLRLQEMDSDHGGWPAERRGIETAQSALEVLRKRVVMPQNLK
jgi:hypothetical protein